MTKIKIEFEISVCEDGDEDHYYDGIGLNYRVFESKVNPNSFTLMILDFWNLEEGDEPDPIFYSAHEIRAYSYYNTIVPEQWDIFKDLHLIEDDIEMFREAIRRLEHNNLVDRLEDEDIEYSLDDIQVFEEEIVRLDVQPN